MIPPEPIVLRSARPFGLTAKDEIWLLPALTANSQRPSALNTSAPCEPRLLPAPTPPVATMPAAVRLPSAARLKIATWLLPAALVRV